MCVCVDEKSQIQALERSQPGLPLKKGRSGTMTHDYKRHGTTTLFAALNVLDGTQKRLRRGNFTGVMELIAAIKDYLAQNNKQPKPFVWTATAQQIIERSIVVKEFLRHNTSFPREFRKSSPCGTSTLISLSLNALICHYANQTLLLPACSRRSIR